MNEVRWSVLFGFYYLAEFLPRNAVIDRPEQTDRHLAFAFRISPAATKKHHVSFSAIEDSLQRNQRALSRSVLD